MIDDRDIWHAAALLVKRHGNDVSELAKLRGTSFDRAATGFTFARAALIDPAFKPD